MDNKTTMESPVPQKGQPYLSPSRVEKFLGCEFYYDMKYIKLVPSDENGNPAMLLGTVVDHALNAMYEIKMRGYDVPMDTILEQYEKEIESEWERQALNTEKKVDMILNGFKLINMYYTSMFQMTDAVATQGEVKGFLEFNGVKIPVLGYLDLITKDIIFDHKVTARSVGGKLPYKHWLQVGTYSAITGIREVAIVYLLNQKTPRIEIVPYTMTDNDIRHIKRIYYGVWQRIKLMEEGTVISIPNRSYEWCNTNCDFARQCGDYYKGYIKQK